ncbi:MAG: diguanylate cyclase [Lachnospiraceae bacterium]|nr:diguanylate cyclase [Lachnospiraceae bacterium]
MDDVKTIVVLEQDLTVDYVGDALDGIRDYYSDKNVKLIMTHTMLPGAEYLDHGYQYWTMMEVLDNESVDGYIVISGSYLSKLDREELAGYLKPLSRKPMVSMSVSIGLEGVFNTSISCGTGYDDVVSHLVNIHGCKRFAFISANATKSIESFERSQAFEKACDRNGVLTENRFYFDSFFTFGDTKRIILEYIDSNKEFPFDAVVAANDRMALGCISALEERGIRVPEDVKVVGYDNIRSAETSTPTLSTISQDLHGQGYTVANLLYAMLQGKGQEVDIQSKVRPIYRQSCGCISREDTRHYLSADSNGKLREFSSSLAGISDIIHSNEQFSSIYILLGVLQNADNYESIVSRLPGILEGIREIDFFALCLYQTAVEYVASDEKFSLPSRVYLSLYWNRNGKSESLEEYNSFNPKREIIPYIEECKTGSYFLHPICYGKKQYGYMLLSFSGNNYLLYSIYMRIISNFVSQGQDFSAQLNKNAELDNLNKRLETRNSDLSRLNITDELTGILNRRGIQEYGQNAIDLSLNAGKNGLVLFADMNGLKTINDTFGHDMGDLAIQTQAEVLKLCSRGSDVVGRMSGDEFAMVAPGMPLSVMDSFRDRIKKTCEEMSRANGLPFVISISMGAVEFTPEERSIEKLISLADEEQYVQKRRYHQSQRE